MAPHERRGILRSTCAARRSGSPARLSPYGRQKRPRLRGLGDAELVEFMSRDMAAREPFYAQAQLIVDCGELSDDEVVETILRHTMQNE